MAEPTDAATGNGKSDASADLLKELVAHLSANRTDLRQEWARRIGEARLLTALTQEEIFNEATSVYDNYVEVLETGSVEALQDYARNLSERIIPRGVETDEVLGIVLLLRDVLARSLFQKYQTDFDYLNQVLDAYEPAANRIANTVAINFVQERERVIRQQQEAIRELSTPVLQVRERLLILPIIGVIDPQRARQLTEQLLQAIRTNRAKVVVIDITGVAAMDKTVANHLVQTVEASRLLTYRAAWLKDQGRRMTLESSMAKLYASEAAVRASEDCVQIHGGYGFVKDYPAEKFFRDVKLTTIGEGTSEIQRLVIARQLLAA